MLEWKSAFKTPNLGQKKKHVTCEKIMCMISLITTRAWLHPEKATSYLAGPYYAGPQLTPALIGVILQILTVKLS